jgi:outer membrane protein assembly factor BamB
VLLPRCAARRGAILPLLVALAPAACDRHPTDSPTTRVRERWHQAQPGYGWARPAVAGGLAYFGTGDGRVIARDVATGAARWAAQVGAERVEGANFVVRGGVVMVSVVWHTVGLDAATGRELWRYEAPRDAGLGSSGTPPGQVALSALDADDEAVYVPAWGASVSALDLRTGAVRWVWQPGRAPTDTAAAGRFRSGSMGVRVSGDTVFATAWHFTVANGVRSEAWLLALDRATGRELWRAVLPNARGGTVPGAPALVGRHAIMNTSEVRVYAVDRATGALAWEFRPPGSALTPFAQTEAYGDAVYVDGGDGHVHALRASDGAVRWRGAFPAQATKDLLVTERRVYVPVSGSLFVLDRGTGRQVAEVGPPRADSPLFASPVSAAGGRVFATVLGAAWSFDEP